MEDILPLEITVAGWQHYQGPYALSKMIIGEEVELHPDPLNPWDAYAVEVFDKRKMKIGFIPRDFSRAVYNHIVSEIPLNCMISNIDQLEEYHPVRIRLDSPEA